MAAATAGTIALDHPTLAADPNATAQVTVTNGACGTLLGLGAGSALVRSDGASLFSSGSGFAHTASVSLGSSGQATVVVKASGTAGLQNIWATFSPGALTSSCTGQTAPAQLSEVGTPTAVTLDAPAPARLQVSTPATRAHVIAHVVDAQRGGIPGQSVLLIRNGATAVAMTDAGGGSYTADLAPAARPASESLTAVDLSVTPNLQSAPQTLSSASSNADCATAGGGSGLGLTPAAVTADGTSPSVARATFATGAGHPAAGEPVSFSGGPGLTITGASATTDAAGVATATVHPGYSV
ncbi:MAG TPA: Ig-like domain-containing protein, partial [Candidatus Dormibacteraeota bacterium]